MSDAVGSVRQMMDLLGVTVADLAAAEAGTTGGVTFAGFLPDLRVAAGAAADTYDTYWRVIVEGVATPTCVCSCERCRDTRRAGDVGGHCDKGRCFLVEPPRGEWLLSRPDWPAAIHQLALVVRSRAEVNAALKAAARRAAGGSAHQGDGRGAHAHLVAAARCAFKHAKKAGHVRSVPELDAAPRRKVRRAGRALSDMEVAQVWDLACSGGDDPELDMMVVWFLLETGCRRAGLLRLRVCDLLPAVGKVRLREKRNTERDQPVSPELVAALLAFVASRAGNRLTPDTHVFLHKPGLWLRGHLRFCGGELTDEPHPVGRSRIQTLFGRLRRTLPWADEVGLHAHDMRRTAATLVERAAGKGVAIRFLGHAPADQSDLYVVGSDDEVADVVARLTARPADSPFSMFLAEYLDLSEEHR